MDQIFNKKDIRYTIDIRNNVFEIDYINTPYAIEFGVGTPGTNGINGVGVPTGGTTGQYLVKKSNSDYDCEWIDFPN